MTVVGACWTFNTSRPSLFGSVTEFILTFQRDRTPVELSTCTGTNLTEEPDTRFANQFQLFKDETACGMIVKPCYDRDFACSVGNGNSSLVFATEFQTLDLFAQQIAGWRQRWHDEVTDLYTLLTDGEVVLHGFAQNVLRLRDQFHPGETRWQIASRRRKNDPPQQAGRGADPQLVILALNGRFQNLMTVLFAGSFRGAGQFDEAAFTQQESNRCHVQPGRCSDQRADHSFGVNGSTSSVNL